MAWTAPVDAWLPKNMVVANKKDFDKLDKATQDIVMKLAAEAEKKGWDRMRAYTNESLGILVKNNPNLGDITFIVGFVLTAVLYYIFNLGLGKQTTGTRAALDSTRQALQA